MAKKTVEASAEWDQIEIGDQVKHAKWGVGTVLFRSGMGETAKAIVVFPEEGQIKLMLKYAKLKKVGTTSLKSVEKLKAQEAAAPKARPERVAPVRDEDAEGEELEAGDDDEELLLDDEEVAGFDDDEEDEFAGRDDGKDDE